MADELLEDVTTGLGQHLLHRAAVPGVIRPDLAAGIQRRFSAGEGGLAAEIWHRWYPAAPLAWGHGLVLAHAGFGGGGDPSPGRTPGPPGEGSGGRASFIPSISPPLHPQEAGLKGADLDVILPPSPGGAGEGTEVSVSAQRGSLSSPPPRGGEPRSVPAASRGVGNVALVQRKAAAAASSLPSGAEPGPAIARRAANPALAQRASAPRSGAVLGPAIFRRSSSRLDFSSMPLPRMAEPAVARRSAFGEPTSPSADRALRSKAERGPAIAHRAALPAPGSLASLASGASGPLPSAPLLLFARPVRTEPAASAATAALPVAAASAGAATRNAQHRSFSPVAFVQPTMASNPLPAASLPFARPARVIERVIERDVVAGGSVAEPQPGTGTDSAPATPMAPLGMAAHAARPAAAEKLDLDDLAERVMHRLARSLAVERERHGGRRWL